MDGGGYRGRWHSRHHARCDRVDQGSLHRFNRRSRQLGHRNCGTWRRAFHIFSCSGGTGYGNRAGYSFFVVRDTLTPPAFSGIALNGQSKVGTDSHALNQCPPSGVKRTLVAPSPMSANDLLGRKMSEREGRKFFFLLQAFLAALFLIVGVALAIEAASGGYGMGLVIVTVMANGPGLVFFILAALSAATAMHLRP